MKAFNHITQTGFTLIELLVTISIMAIIAAMAAPSFQDQIAKRKMEDALNKMETCFKDSKIQANILHRPVDVRLSTAAAGTSIQNCGSQASVEIAKPLSITLTNATTAMQFNPNGTVAFTGKAGTTSETVSVCYDGYTAESLELTINARGRLSRGSGGGTC